jgi:predicted methyltransferase
MDQVVYKVETLHRLHARAEVRWPVTIRTAQEVIEAKLRNLGAGGAYIHCDHTPEPGESVELTIRPPDSPPIEITAEVMWAGKVLALGMGVRFVEISDKDLQFISRTVSEELGDNNNL